MEYTVDFPTMMRQNKNIESAESHLGSSVKIYIISVVLLSILNKLELM